MLGLSLALMVSLAPQAQAVPQPVGPPAFTIAIDEPVYTGQPVWIRAVDGERANIRYPFGVAVSNIGCNRLEVKRDGVLLTPLPLRGEMAWTGPMCGSGAPRGSPANRLPLHILYPFKTAGTYSVRWTELVAEPPSREGGWKTRAQSEWLTFSVLESTPEQHEAWLKNLLANAPQDDGELAGDFLPSLMAAAPDPRVLDTFVRYLYSTDGMVSGVAASALEVFPQPEVLRAVAASLEKNGPSEQLAGYATMHTGWTADDESKIVHAAIPYLQPSNPTLPSGKPLPPYAPTQTSAAIKLLMYIFYIPNHAWPANSELASYADAQVLLAAPNIMANANMNAVQELAEYLGSMQFSLRAHELLGQIAERSDNAGTQARICLTWHPQANDLQRLAAFLVGPDDADRYGTDRSSLPNSLVRGYGDAAFPYLEDAVANSPYVWVRVQSAQQLALHGRPVGFQFLLDQLVQDPWPANQAYKPQLVQWTKLYFRTDLPADANEQQVVVFLRSKIPPSQ